jgi:hypothetical protein
VKCLWVKCDCSPCFLLGSGCPMAVLGADRLISPIFAALRVQGPFFTVVRSDRAINQLINDPALTRIFCSSQYKKIRKFTETAHLIIQGKNQVKFNHLLNSHLMKKYLNDRFRPLQLEANCLESSTIFFINYPLSSLAISGKRKHYRFNGQQSTDGKHSGS